MVKKYVGLLLVVLVLFSCEEIFEVTDISEQQVSILAPTDQSVVTDTLVNFNWNSVSEADSYQVQVATPDFQNTSQLVLDTILVLDSTYVGNRISKKLTNNNYQWRIKALNSDFETEYSLSSFTVETPSN